MTVEHIAEAIRGIRPGARMRIYCIEIDVPLDAENRLLPESQVAELDAATERHLSETDVDSPPAARSPLERVRAETGAASGRSRKQEDWAAAICRATDFSARELERACRAGAVVSTKKLEGLDAGARLIKGVALENYLTLREQVIRGDVPPPAWWDAVVKSNHSRAKQRVSR